ncbi:MAG: hypothetical protein RLY30_1842 [Pseudomonadota bacterium]
MKILHVEAGRHLYGGARQVLHLMEGLAHAGHENLLVCPPGAEYIEPASAFARVIPLRMGGDLDLGLYARLLSVLRAERPDLIHAHSRRGADVYPGLCGARLSIPTVLSRRVDNRERGWLARLRARLFDRVVVISQAIGDVQASMGVPAHKMICIRDAIDATGFTQPMPADQWRAAHGLAPDAVVMAMVAQFIPRKGHHELMLALEALLPRHPQLYLALFGRGPLEAEIQQIVRAQGWTERVRFMGFVDDLPRQLGALTMLVHPAAAEGLGVSLLQASAAGLPIVATAVGGIPEAVQAGVTGILVPPGDGPALVQAIEALLADPVRRAEMGAAGRLRVQREFSVQHMVGEHIRLYQSLVE